MVWTNGLADQTPTPASTPTTAPAGGRRGSKRRKFLYAAVCLAGSWWLLMHGFVGRWIIQSALTSAVGTPVKIGSISIWFSGRSELRRITIAGDPAEGPRNGPARQFISIDALTCFTHWTHAVTRAGPVLDGIRAEGLRVRVSQNTQTGAMNVPRFSPGGQSSGSPDLPSVEIRGGIIELGEHDDKGNYTPLQALRVSGGVYRGDNPGESVFRLAQEVGSSTNSQAPRFEVSGRIDADLAEARLKGLSLGGIDPQSVPSRFRELFQALDLKGSVGETRFTYHFPKPNQPFDPALAVEAVLEVDGVAVTLPVDRFVSSQGGTTKPRMTQVYGRLSVSGGKLQAKLGGFLEDLPYTVELFWNGPSIDAPFECVLTTRQFELERNPKLLPFLPPKVHERLAMFSAPTALLDSRVVVSRAAAAGPTSVAGAIQFTAGRAAFIRFPYEFGDMRGLLEFDDTTLRIVRIEGTADSGATIRASGTISPLTDEAAVSLDITVKGVPVDDALAQGLGPRRRGVIDALFNRDRYAELLATGLVVTPSEGARRAQSLQYHRDELAAARNSGDARRLSRAEDALAIASERARVPIFEPGGTGDVTLKLETPFGKDMPWTQLIDITIPSAMMLPKRFPYPVIARDVKLHVDDTTLTLVDGVFEGLAGGRANVRASADFSSGPPAAAPAPTGATSGTEVTITASRIPLDPLLLHALPAKERPIAAPDDKGVRRTLGQVIEDLNLSGEADATVVVRDEGTGASTFEADVKFDQTRCVPTGFFGQGGKPESGVALRGMNGELKVSDESLSLALRAAAAAANDPPDAPARGSIAIRTSATFGDSAKGTPPTVQSSISLDGFDSAIRVEPAIAVFAPSAAKAVAELRTRYEPAGTTDVYVRVESEGDSPTSITVDAKAPAGFQIAYKPLDGKADAPGVPVKIGPMAGSLRYTSNSGSGRVEFDNIAAELTTLDGKSAGFLELAGTLGLGDQAASDMRFKATGARFESPLAAAVIADRLRGGFADFYTDRAPAGLFDADLRIFRNAGPGLWDVQGKVLPLSLAARTDLARMDAPKATGQIRFTRDEGVFDKVSLTASDWSASLGGGWSLLPGGGSALTLKIDGTATGVPDSLKGLLPLGVRTTMDDLKFATTDRIDFQNIEVGMVWGPPPPSSTSPTPVTPGITASGSLRFINLAADVGVNIVDANGRAKFESRTPTTGPTEFKVGVELATAKAARVSLTDLRAVALSGRNAGEVIVPTFQADCHRGRVSGEADLKPVSPADPDGPKAFSTRIDLSGVELEGVLKDFSTNSKPPEGGRSATIDAGINMGGITGDPASRRGRGTIYVGGGQVLSLPLVLPLIQVSSLQLPTAEQLDNARATFYIDGLTVGVERLSLYSPSVELRGFGLVTWPNLDLDLIVNSKAVTRMPLFTSIVEGLRDEFVTTTVRGTPKNPEVSVTPFRGTKGALSGFFGTESQRDRRMRRLEAESQEQEDRLRVPVETKPRK